tara:strand:+ start:1016 stop:1243 length:228 start_codon:yes stop_codon:yes gene_type:complete
MSEYSLTQRKYFTIGEEVETVEGEGWQHLFVTPEEDYKILPPVEQLDVLVKIEKELVNMRSHLMDVLFINTKYPS